MYPLIIVGILISTALADVSHVLSGEAHPPANPVDINALTGPKNAFQSGNPNDFWWMKSNSPLKEAYEYFKKCSNKGDCLPPVSVVPGLSVAEAHFDPIDLKKNPFLNGEYQKGGESSSSISSSSSGCTSCSGGSKSGEVAAFHTGTKIDITNNPFLSGQYATAGNGEKIKNENGFIGVQPKKPGFATSHPLTNKKPFSTSLPNAPQSFVLGGEVQGEECKGQGYLCVKKNLCINGIISKAEELLQVKNDVQFCNVNTEVCCRLTNTPSNIVLPNVFGKTSVASSINNLADITAGKSSVTGSSFKFSAGAGSSPGQIQVLIDQYDDVKPQIYNNGESGSQYTPSTNKTIRDVTLSANSVFPSTIDYSGVEIPNDIRFASTIRGPAYLPPLGGPTPPSSTPELIAPTQPTIITYQPSVPTTQRPIQTTGRGCPPGTYLTPSGICETLNTPVPPCPFGTIRTPVGNCERLVISTTPRPCPPGTILTSFGSCEAPTTPTPACPYGTILTPDGSCARPSPPPTPSPSPRPCPPGTFLTSSGLCEALATPLPTCPFGTIQRPDGTCERPRFSTTIRPSPPPSPRPCPAGTFLTASGTCEAPSCPTGTIRTFDGTCISPGTPTTPQPCPPGTISTALGICEFAVTSTPRPSCPPGTIQTPSGICERPIGSSTTIDYSSPCPPGTFITPTGICERPIVTTARPQCPPGTYLTPFGNCEPPLRTPTPKPPPRPFQTTASRDYLPPVTPQYVPSVTQKPYQPSITTEKPFQPSVTPKKTSVTPYKPFKPSVTPSKPFQPSFTPQTPTETTQKPYYSQVTTPRPPQPSVTTLRPYEPSSPKPNPFLTTKKDFTPTTVCLAGQVPSPSGYGCIYPSTAPKTDTCLPGQRLSPSGICEYPFSTPSYEYPKPSTDVLSCGLGKVLSSSGACINSPRPTPQPSCGVGQVLSPSGSCIYTSQPHSRPPFGSKPPCAPGQIPSSSGICTYASTPIPSHSEPTNQPYCKPGLVLSPSGSCIYSPQSTPRRDENTPRPSCLPGQTVSPSGECKYSSQKPGYDYPKPTSASCSPGQVLLASGICTYSSQSTTPPSLVTRPACQFGQILSPAGVCIYSSQSGSSTSRPAICLPGQQLSSSGLCEYITTEGYKYPQRTTPRTAETCSAGQILSPTGSCIYSSQASSRPHLTQSTPRPQFPSKPSCQPGQVPSPSGYGCVYPLSSSTARPFSSTQGYDYPKPTASFCPPGQILSGTGSCIYSSETTTEYFTSPKQSCGPGQVPRPSGIGCEYPKAPKPTRPSFIAKPSCPFGTKLSAVTNECVGSDGFTGYESSKSTTPQSIVTTSLSPISTLRPACRPGQIQSSSGICTYPSQPQTSCRPGQIKSPTGICIYPSDTTTPLQPTLKPSCGPGQILSSGLCVYPSQTTPIPQQKCALGQKLSSSGSCVSATISPRPTPSSSCPPGQVPSSSGVGCVYSPTTSKSCPFGQKLSPSGSCELSISTGGYDYSKPSKQPPKSCPDGQILAPSGYGCIYSEKTSPRPLSCSQGQVPAPSGVGCEYPKTTKPPVLTQPTVPCPFGAKLSPITNECITSYNKRPGYEYPKPSTPFPSELPSTPSRVSPKQCPSGQILSSSGSCVYSSETTSVPSQSCAPGQIASSSGICTYPSYSTPRPSQSCSQGQILSASGRCIYSSTTPTSCKLGEVLSPSGGCISVLQSIPTTKQPSCRHGQILSNSGVCIYPGSSTSTPTCGFGQVLSPSGSCVYPSSSTPRPVPSVTTGYDYPKPTPSFETDYTSERIITPPKIRECGPGQILSSSGSCIYSSRPTIIPQTVSTTTCVEGQILSSSGICIYTSSHTEKPRPGEKFSCGPGQELSKSGICFYPSRSSPKPSCPSGQVLSSAGSCIYPLQPTSEVVSARPTTPFIPGFSSQTTIRPTTFRQCGLGQILSSSGACIYQTSPKLSCKPGQELSETGTCFYPSKPSSKPSCAPEQILSSSGSCIYPLQSTKPIFTASTGYQYPRPSTPFEPSRITTIKPITCGSGQILSPIGTCIYPSSQFSATQTTPKPSCRPGQELSEFGTCFYPSTSKPSCGPGQILSSTGSCIYPLHPTVQPFPITSTAYDYSEFSTTFRPNYSKQTTIRPSTGRQCGPSQVLSQSGACVNSTPQTTRPETSPKQSCKPGQEISESGICFYPSRPGSKPTCGPGEVLSSSGSCIYPLQPTSQPIPTASTGYDYSRPSTVIIPDYTSQTTVKPTIKECRPGQILSSSGLCIYQTTGPQLSPKPSCLPGQELSESGICFYPSKPSSKPSCGPGQILSASGSCIYSERPTSGPFNTISTGYEYPKPSTPFKSNYPSKATLSPTTIQQCRPGQILSPSGACVYSFSETTIPEPTTKPSCRFGQELSDFGTCVYPSKPSSKPSCGPGQILSSSGSCIYSEIPTSGPVSTISKGYEYPKPSTPFKPNYPSKATLSPTTIRQCRPNQILSPSGACVYSSSGTIIPELTTKPSCRFGQELSDSGTCVYPSKSSSKSCSVGQILSSSGLCIYPSPTANPTGYEYSRPSTPLTPNYPSQTTVSSPTSKQCSPGQIISASGNCIYLTKPAPSPSPSPRPTVRPSPSVKSCGLGQTLSLDGICIYTSQSTPTPSCKPGQILSSSGNCIYTFESTPRPQYSCQPGQILSPSGICIPSTPSFSETTLRPTQCPPGAKPSAFGSGCEYTRITTLRPTVETFTGYNYPKPNKPFEPKPQCSSGKRLGPSGLCESVLGSTTPSYETDFDSTTNYKRCPPGSKLSPSGTCQFISNQPSSTITPEYAVTCPIGTIKTSSGLCESNLTLAPLQCPFGTRLSPSGSCERTGTFRPPISQNDDKSCPPGTIKTSTGLCELSSSPSNNCPPGTYKTVNGDCKSSTIPSPIPSLPPQRPVTCPPGSSPSPSGRCQYSSPTPIPGQSSDTNNQFTPSYPTKKPYRPTSPPSNGYYYETPTPTFGYPISTLIPNSNIISTQYALPPTTAQYLPPPSPDKEIQGSRIRDLVRLPDRPTTDNNVESGNNINSVLIPSTSTRRPPQFRPPQFQEPNNEPPVGCAAALKCVQEIYCTAEGVVSPVPVVLTKDQELLRVPTTECREEETGIIGKCCRDPNYKDPWPSANLVNGVDDGQYKEDNLYGQRQVLLATNRLVRSSNVTKTGARESRDLSQNVQENPPSCGERHKNTKPLGPGPLDANFAEYPWQAMILRDSNRSLLCGGAIIRKNAVLTTAHCVEGLDTSDVLIKGGEWKLGIDEEPLPFQIVKVGAILRHPEYVPGSYKNDLAVLILREKLRPSKNIGTICLPEANQVPITNCVATGWGKRILQLHAKGAIMHHINVNVMDGQKCKQTLEQNFQSFIENYGSKTLCGVSDIDHCKVDYGSALACANAEGHYTLAGVYAWDTGCKEENQIGGYIAPDVEWIQATLTKSIKELKKIEREYLLKSRG